MTDSIKAQVASACIAFIRETTGEEVDSSKVVIDATKKEFEGDYTLVVFPFVRMLRTSPEQAGEKIGEYLKANMPAIADFNVIKGFLNLSLTADFWSKTLSAAATDDTWLSPADKKDLILVEYSSPNTNKPLHLGHLRNNFLGHSVSLIRAFSGSEVVKTQIINDRGVHICKSMLAWKRFGEGETPESAGMKGDKLVGKYYVLYDQHFRKQVEDLVANGVDEEDAKKQAPLSKDVQEMLLKWEQGDPETVELWSMMNSWVYDGFDSTYRQMGVDFDKLYYESNTYAKGKEIVHDGLEKGLFFRKDDGSIWVDLSADGLDEKLLIRGDGTTVYMTQDIGTAVQRYEDFPELSQIVYTVGDEQDYHFKVLFLVLEKLGYDWAPACRHLSYGMVDLPSGKMKSREGTVVDADDLMADVIEAAKASSQEKGKLDEMEADEQEALFEMLGVGALKFFLLRVDPRKRMLFNPEESVSLSGDTGPFVQYTHARCKAVLRKAGKIGEPIVSNIEDKERQLLRALMDFRNIANQAADDMNPSLIASYCLDIAKLYNQFYHDHSILNADEEGVKAFRLHLTSLTASSIASAMALLGIQVPDRM